MRASLALLFLMSTVLLALSVPTSNAQPAPEVKFSLAYLASSSALIKPIPIGPGRELTVSSARVLTANDAGTGLFHHLIGRCLMSAIVDKEAATLEQHGFCAYADADGDRVWETVDTDKQPFGPVFTGNGELIWGTGKYAGIDGSFEIHHSPKSAIEGVMHGFGKVTGSYRLRSKR